jgi:hypothetical protein
VERITADVALPGGLRDARRFTGVDTAVGYRLTPELTVRAGHRARLAFGVSNVDHAATASLVWWRRWR